MTTRQQQIEQIASIIRSHFDDLGEPFTFEDAERVNETTGWTFDTPAPLGHVIRHEGVVLSRRELAQAWAQAEQMDKESL